MNRVFVIQNQHKWNGERNQFEPKYNLDSAKEFGELVYLLTPTAGPFNLPPVVKEIKAKLVDFSDEDYLLLIGNPVLIGVSMSIAAAANDGNVKVLQWSGKEFRYLPIEVKGLWSFKNI